MDAATAIGITADKYTDLWVTEGSKYPGRPGMYVHLNDKSVWVPLPPLKLKDEPIPVGPAPIVTEEEKEADRLEWLELLRTAREELSK